ncbi:peptide-methionine (S)-S-oxide reductase MsrA [Prochlorococcus marinus]|uniref:peptide-methionine (S)-S-oxide reductase MsrA n=1 Tax=Prochlorococcus marinus TaxID=1219 RepID=UPI0022B595F2|nr:peptide-methionine (S)-S-oxide reductase MsrA [Prochlorococcus marinus]
MFKNWLTKEKENSYYPEGVKHFVLGNNINYKPSNKQSEIYFGCGCFWGAEKGFWKLPGVITTAVGYAGGDNENPTYRQVCSGNTNHAEVVRVVWEKSEIDISDLLKMFWECHDPTQGNRQGNDCGSQYRSAIFTNNKEHLEIAFKSLNAYQNLLTQEKFGSITTEVSSNQTFYFAEEYHQQYLAKPGSRPYCSAMPTNISLQNFPGSDYKLSTSIWENFNWEENHCVLRSSNDPIKK